MSHLLTEDTPKTFMSYAEVAPKGTFAMANGSLMGSMHAIPLI